MAGALVGQYDVGMRGVILDGGIPGNMCLHPELGPY